MFNSKSLLALGFAAVFLASCNKDVTVSISASSTEPLPDEEIEFSAGGSEAAEWSWDFGDGTTSSEKAPVHSYVNEGTYEVTVTAYSSGRKKWAKAVQQIVVKHPLALFTGQLNGTNTRFFHLVKGYEYRTSHNQVISGTTAERIYQAKIGTYSGATPLEEINFEIGTAAYPDTLTLTESLPYFQNLIKVMDYSTSFSAGAANGIKISYKSPSGVIWSTDAGSANQSSSSVIITYCYNTTEGSSQAEFFKAHVNCKLYNGLGGEMTLTNGILELYIAHKP